MDNKPCPHYQPRLNILGCPACSLRVEKGKTIQTIVEPSGLNNRTDFGLGR